VPKSALEVAESPARIRSQAHWVLLALAPMCALVLVVLGAVVRPSPSGFGTHTQLGLRPCLAMQWLGLPCPGCGVTTSVALAAHGHPLAAFVNQPFGLIVAALLAVYPLWALWQVAHGRDLYACLARQSARAWMIFLGLSILMAWIYKLAVVLAS
jgi:Protein of unknown function (DUF2752)